MPEILKRASRLVEPTQKEIEHVNMVANKALELVKKTSAKFNGIVDVIFGGSYAKDTWLKDDVDVDIFVQVRSDIDEGEFEKIGRMLGLQALKEFQPYLRYSEHPYVEAFVDKIRVNVVPCYDVDKGNWKSAADRSPYHTKFIRASFDDGRRREARLLKKFMKTIGVYGAEIATNGFSGYVCEVLVVKYGSCMDVLKEAAKFKEKQVVSVGSFNEDVVKLFDSALIIIDPVDNKRNLGTAISDESVGRLILAARRFVAKPDIKFFSSIPTKGHLKLTDNMILIKFKYKNRSPDIIWGQLKSSVKAIAKQLSIRGFRTIRHTAAADENGSAVFVFLLQSIKLPSMIVRQGPKIFEVSDSKNFVEKNLATSNIIWVDDETRLLALRNNEFVDAIDFLKFLLSKNINSSGISPGIIGDLRRGFRIYRGNKLKSVKEGFVREAIAGLVATDQFAFDGNKGSGR